MGCYFGQKTMGSHTLMLANHPRFVSHGNKKGVPDLKPIMTGFCKLSVARRVRFECIVADMSTVCRGPVRACSRRLSMIERISSIFFSKPRSSKRSA